MLSSIERKLLRIGRAILSIVVLIPDDRPFIKTTTFDNSTKYVFDVPTFLKLRLFNENGSTWDNTGFINLNYIGKIQMVSTMKNMINLILNQRVFYDDPEYGLQVTQNNDKNGNSKWALYERIGEANIAIHPYIIEEDMLKMEGVRLIINKPENFAIFTTSEFIALTEALSAIDIWILSQELINSIGVDRLLKMPKINNTEYELTISKLDDLESSMLSKLDKKDDNGK